MRACVVVIVLAACGAGVQTMNGDDMVDAPPALDDGMDPTMPDGAMGLPTAAELLTKVATCTSIGGIYSIDSGSPGTVSICSASNAVFWKADLDVDCDGLMSADCNINADPDYQNQTAATDSHGNALDAAALPYVVVPGHSTRWDYRTADLHFGSVFAVIYQDKVEYGVFGDIGPTAIIGEASYAMASALGIDPDPSTGGVDSGVTYIAFTGTAAVAAPIESHDAAVAIGIAYARALIAGP
ncbi:MAG TPA: glycoside hydrolase family 75 protein [Kofleriaceae bacterium]